MVFSHNNHLFINGQSGGISNRSVAGIVSGCKVTAAFTATTVTATVQPGTVRFDGTSLTWTTNQVTSAINISAFASDLTTWEGSLDLYLSPPRKVPIVTTLPGSVTTEMVALASKVDNHYVITELYKDKAGVYATIPPLTSVPESKSTKLHSRFNLDYNDIDPTGSPIIGFTPEYPAFMQSRVPPHVSRSLVNFRQGASIVIAVLNFKDGAMTVTVPDKSYLPI